MKICTLNFLRVNMVKRFILQSVAYFESSCFSIISHMGNLQSPVENGSRSVLSRRILPESCRYACIVIEKISFFCWGIYCYRDRIAFAKGMSLSRAGMSQWVCISLPDLQCNAFVWRYNFPSPSCPSVFDVLGAEDLEQAVSTIQMFPTCIPFSENPDVSCIVPVNEPAGKM